MTEKTDTTKPDGPLIGTEGLPPDPRLQPSAERGGSLLDFMENFQDPMGEYTPEQQELIDAWAGQLETDNLRWTPFRDPDFLDGFVQHIPLEQQMQYVENTNNFQASDGQFDPRYVLVTRRAVQSDEPKPEPYWSVEHRTPRLGLRRELPENSAQRILSEIMVSTLGALQEHGDDQVDWDGAASDGEVRVNKTPFDKEKVLFTYKPGAEQAQLEAYLAGGGKSREDVLAELKAYMEGLNSGKF